MKVTVVAFDDAESRKAKEGLTKLKKGIGRFRSDLKDNRVDLDTLESFVKGLRAVANYFDRFAEDELGEDGQDMSGPDIDADDYQSRYC